MNIQNPIRNFVGLFCFGLAGTYVSSLPALAEDKDVAQQVVEQGFGQSVQPDYVVELFTSQGCSSCPPANRFVSDLAQEKEEALVLSYGVTYWDYLGWKDTFGDPAFTKRQHQYVKLLGAPNAYTPQIVLNGSAHSPRYTTSDIVSMPLAEERSAASLTAIEGGQILIKADLTAGHSVSFIRFTPGLQNVDVKRGENGGRTLKINNVVSSVQTLPWTGSEISLPANFSDGQSYAALFHAPDSAKIVTAAVLALDET